MEFRYGEEEHHSECSNCGKQDCTTYHYYEHILCSECDDSRDNKTGYCDMDCQLGNGCSGAC